MMSRRRMTIQTAQLEALLDAQQIVIEKIALDESTHDCLEAICLQIERVLNDPKVRSSIMVLRGKTLHHGAAPHLPLPFTEQVEGLEVGPEAGSCGVAVSENKQVIIADIAKSDMWKNVVDTALQFGLKACWSTPIRDSSGAVMGTFAIYYTEVKEPESFHLSVIDRFTSLAGLVLERHKAKVRERVLNQHLATTMERFQVFAQVMPDIGLIINEDGDYVDIYGSETNLLYRDASEVIGNNVSEVLPPEMAKEVMRVINKTLSTGVPQVYEYQLNVPKGFLDFEGRTAPINRYSAADPDKRHILWMARDVTERKQAEREIKQLAFFDSLTNLPNRRLLMDRLDRVMARVRRENSCGALIFIDLDNFKSVNDSMGHSVGDELLVQVADRLTHTLRDADTIARMGGDEFVVIVEGTAIDSKAMEQEARIVAQRILDSLVPSFIIKDKSIHVNGSLGVALIDSGLESADDVLGLADSAMYRAKREGRGKACFTIRVQ